MNPLSRPSAHLTALMRTALQDAARHNEGLRRTFDDKPGRPSWPYAPNTLHALTRRGLLETRELRNRRGYRIQAWFITPEGRRALEPVLVVKRDVPLYLASAGGVRYETLSSGRQRAVVDEEASTDPADRGYTTSRHRAIDDLETMDPALLHPDWQQRAEIHRRLARSDVNAARLSGLTHPEDIIAEARRLGRQLGIDMSEEERFAERAARAFKRKLGRDAA